MTRLFPTLAAVLVRRAPELAPVLRWARLVVAGPLVVVLLLVFLILGSPVLQYSSRLHQTAQRIMSSLRRIALSGACRQSNSVGFGLALAASWNKAGICGVQHLMKSDVGQPAYLAYEAFQF